MVEDFNLEELAGLDEVAGDLDVRLGGCGITRGVDMGDDDGCGVGGDGDAEDFAGVNEPANAVPPGLPIA